MSSKFTTKDHYCPVWSAVEAVYERAVELLRTNKENIKIINIDDNTFPLGKLSDKYQESIHRDRPVHQEGVVDSLPFVARQRLHQPYNYGCGITLFEQQKTGIRYVHYYDFDHQYNSATFVFIKKKDILRYHRHAQRVIRNEMSNTIAPIVDDGLLEQIVQHTVGFLAKSRAIKEFGVQVRRGILLTGGVGLGKTMLCRYIQKLCASKNINYSKVASSDIEKAYAEQELDELFCRDKVLFFDDIDIQYLNRKSGDGKIACSVLGAMDGLDNRNKTVVRIFTTNEDIEDLDEAFVRPGRIDLIITLEKPNIQLRRKLIESWPSSIINHIDVNQLAQVSGNWSFADIEEVRSLLVTNYLDSIKNKNDIGYWELDKAIGQFLESKNRDSKKVVGLR